MSGIFRNKPQGRILAGAAVIIGLFFSTSAMALTSFTATYKGNSSSGTSCLYTKNISGKEPDAAGKYPVFLYFVGTGGSYSGATAMNAVTEAANRGFVAATVEYSNGTFGSCSTIGNRAKCAFSGTASAVATICARAKADCSKGIAVGGLSQGSIMATLAKNYEPRVRAAWAKGTMTSYSFYNLDSCMNNGNHTIASTDLRVVNGESDTFGGGSISSVRTESQNVTGLSCGSTATSCLRTDGSGWYIVRHAQVPDGEADHCYEMNGGCNDVLDATYASTLDPWGVKANLDWLKSRVTP